MKLSYLIFTCNEHRELSLLLDTIIPVIDLNDEVVFILDSGNTTQEVYNVLSSIDTKNIIQIHEHQLNKNFAEHKNFGNSKCNGDWIFQIDADEVPTIFLIENIKEIIIENKCDAFWVPRINIVDGLTQDHIKKWGWKITKGFEETKVFYKNTPSYELIKHLGYIIDEEKVNDKGMLKLKYNVPYINFPDEQCRIYKNNSNIKWIKPVHEQLTGVSSVGVLPGEEIYCLLHRKYIDRQEEQNKFYTQI